MGYSTEIKFEPKRGYSYARNSPTKKKKSIDIDSDISNVYSIAEQIKKTRMMSQMDNVALIKEFKDEYISGKTNIYMTNFNEMINSIIEKNNIDNIDIIYCWRVDRFGRNQTEMLNTIKKLIDKNIFVKFVDGGFSTNSTMGRMLMGILSSFSEWQREEIVINTTIGREKEYLLHPEKFGRPKVKIDWEIVKKQLRLKYLPSK